MNVDQPKMSLEKKKNHTKWDAFKTKEIYCVEKHIGKWSNY